MNDQLLHRNAWLPARTTHGKQIALCKPGLTHRGSRHAQVGGAFDEMHSLAVCKQVHARSRLDAVAEEDVQRGLSNERAQGVCSQVGTYRNNSN